MHVDVIEWLGNEQYAYIPYDAPESMVAGLVELERELDSERMRSQLVVALEPMSRIHRRRRRRALARPAPDADLRSTDRREPHPPPRSTERVRSSRAPAGHADDAEDEHAGEGPVDVLRVAPGQQLRPASPHDRTLRRRANATRRAPTTAVTSRRGPSARPAASLAGRPPGCARAAAATTPSA